MNNKEFLSALSARTKMGSREVASVATAVVSAITDELTAEDSVTVSGFGSFEVRKKLERVLVNPSTKQRMLVPPKMTVSFKPSSALKLSIRAGETPTDIKASQTRLAKDLAKRKGMTRDDAGAFLQAFFDIIIQGVTSDGQVKVKGLGTFKLIEVLDRESVSISTGERMVIPGHTRLTFTPDDALRDVVNKPFADFQTVIINEGTNLDDMTRMDSENVNENDNQNGEENDDESKEGDAPLETGEGSELVSEAVSEAEAEPEAEATPELVIEPEEEQKPEPATEPAIAPVPEPAPDSYYTPEPIPAVTKEMPSQMYSEPIPEPTPEPAAKGRALTTAETVALTLGIILLCALSYLIGYYRFIDFPRLMRCGEPATEQTAEVQQMPLPAPEEKDTTAVAPATEEKDTAACAPVPEPQPVPEARPMPAPKPKPRGANYAQVPGGKYRIVGTRRTHVMRYGDYLTRIALQEYGSKDFARYIVVHNDIKNPDNVPIGQQIKLPELVRVRE